MPIISHELARAKKAEEKARLIEERKKVAAQLEEEAKKRAAEVAAEEERKRTEEEQKMMDFIVETKREMRELIKKSYDEMDRTPLPSLIRTEEALNREGYTIIREEVADSSNNQIYKAKKTFKDLGLLDLVVKMTMIECIPSQVRQLFPKVAQAQKWLGTAADGSLTGPLRLPSLVRVYETFYSEKKGYVFMEPLDPITLDIAISVGMPLDDAFSIGTQLAQGLDFLHMHGLAHLNIKPKNVTLGSQNQVRLTGLNRVYRYWNTTTNEIVKHPTINLLKYYNREFYPLSVLIEDFDPIGVDIFSFGALFLRMALHESPFKLGKASERTLLKLAKSEDIEKKWTEWRDKEDHKERLKCLPEKTAKMFDLIFVNEPEKRLAFGVMLKFAYIEPHKGLKDLPPPKCPTKTKVAPESKEKLSSDED